MNKLNVELAKVKEPCFDCTHNPIIVNDQTIQERTDKIYRLMKENDLDCLFIYGDLEHGGNFEYLVGFLPRFEEAVLVFHREQDSYLLLGNENLNKASKSRIKAKSIHVPYFSLPNQPMDGEERLSNIYIKAGITKNTKVGIVGWKLFTGKYTNEQTFDIPNYLITELTKVTNHLSNATKLFIGEHGARTTINANEVLHYEYYSSLASDCMLKTMNLIDEGVTELELGCSLNCDGQRNSVVTIASVGERFVNGNIYPIHKKITYGDKISLTVGYRGGLSSRAGYAATFKGGISEDANLYLEKLVKPYFNAIVTWLENIKCGQKGKEVYDLIENVLPKEQFHWSLNPGHLTAYEEWLSSPIYLGSEEIIQSGMLFQTDIIPSIPGLGGINCESTVLLADENLRSEIKLNYPDLYKRIQNRKNYLADVLNIHLSEDVLPMTSTLAYLRPFMLDKEYALRRKNER